MKKRTYALMIGAIFVAIIIMNANNAISDQQLQAALSNAASMKIVHKTAAPINETPVQNTGTNVYTPIPEGEELTILGKNFNSDSNQVDSDTARALQQFLISAGFLDAKYLTGTLGPRTKQAVIDFQKANNISPASGYIGDQTRALINQRAAASY
jgi:hypothetical protein